MYLSLTTHCYCNAEFEAQGSSKKIAYSRCSLQVQPFELFKLPPAMTSLLPPFACGGYYQQFFIITDHNVKLECLKLIMKFEHIKLNTLNPNPTCLPHCHWHSEGKLILVRTLACSTQKI